MKLSKAQIELMQTLQANPNSKVQRYYSYSAGRYRCFVTNIHVDPNMKTVEKLESLGLLDKAPNERHIGDFNYTLSEKGKAYK